MHFNSKLILTLLATVPSSFAAVNGGCSGRNGICINTSTCSSYGGTSYTGKCPSDPNDVKCCDEIPCAANDGRKGKCMFASQCNGEKISGKCPGGNDFKCCVSNDTYEGTPCNGVEGTCININTTSCGSQTLTGKCPGPANIKCCPKQSSQDPNVGKPCKGVAGTCIDVNNSKCGTRTITGKCPGGSNILCCLADSGNVPSWYIDQTQHTEIICTIPGSDPENKSVKSSGCGISCLSMAINVLENSYVSPEDLFREGYNNGKYNGNGFSHDALTFLGNRHGVKVSWTGNLDTVYSALQNGKSVIYHVGPESRYSFTKGGHYIFLNGAKTENGVQKVYVFDPNGSNNYVNVLFPLRSADGGIEVAKKGTGSDFGIVERA